MKVEQTNYYYLTNGIGNAASLGGLVIDLREGYSSNDIEQAIKGRELFNIDSVADFFDFRYLVLFSEISLID